MEPSSITPWIAVATAVVSVILWLWRHAIASFWQKFRDVVSGLLVMVQLFPKLVEDVSFVKHEVMYNGGSTSQDILRKLSYCVDYLMDDARVSTFQTDRFGLVLKIGDRAVEALRCPREKLIGAGWKSFMAADEVERVSSIWDSIVRDGRGARIESVVFSNDDHGLKVDIEVIPLRDNDGAFSGHLGFVRTAK